MYSIESHVGRLIEVRFWSPVGGDEGLGWRRDHEAMLQSILGGYVFFVDLVEATVFPPELVEAFAATMRNEARLLRSAFVVGASPTLSLQIQRVLRDGYHPHRRVFRETREAESYLAEVVTMPERARLREVLERRGLDPPGPSSAHGPPSVGGSPQSATPSSMRVPQSVRTSAPGTMRQPTTRSGSGNGGQSGSG